MEDNTLVLKVGDTVIHSEQKYVGKISVIIDDDYCRVEPNDTYLLGLYPFGTKARLDKLKLHPREEAIIKVEPIRLSEDFRHVDNRIDPIIPLIIAVVVITILVAAIGIKLIWF